MYRSGKAIGTLTFVFLGLFVIAIGGATLFGVLLLK